MLRVGCRVAAAGRRRGDARRIHESTDPRINSAPAEAASLLGSIVKEGATKLSRAVWEVSKGKAGSTLSGMRRYAEEKGKSILSKIGLHQSREALLSEMEAITAEAAVLSVPEAEDGGSRTLRDPGVEKENPK